MSHPLAQCRALYGFSLQQLTAFQNEAEERRADPGSILFKEGEEADAMVILLEGRLEVRREKGGHILEVPPFSLVGEMGLILGETRSANIVALKASRYLWLSRESFQRLTEGDKDLAYKFFRNLTVMLSQHLQKNNMLLEFYQSLN
jgi:CRP-like cAMP-binding protein